MSQATWYGTYHMRYLWYHKIYQVLEPWLSFRITMFLDRPIVFLDWPKLNNWWARCCCTSRYQNGYGIRWQCQADQSCSGKRTTTPSTHIQTSSYLSVSHQTLNHCHNCHFCHMPVVCDTAIYHKKITIFQWWYESNKRRIRSTQSRSISSPGIHSWLFKNDWNYMLCLESQFKRCFHCTQRYTKFTFRFQKIKFR